jgi:COMPASS component SWD3
MQKFILVIGLCLNALFLAGQKEPFVFHRKLSTWNDSNIMPRGIPSVSFSPDEKTLLVGNPGGDLLVWSVKSGEVLHNLSDLNQHRHIYDIVHSPDGKHFVSVGSHLHHRYITLWDTKGFIPVKTIYYDTILSYAEDPDKSSLESLVGTAVFSKDGKYIITADEAGYINTWEAVSLELVSSLNTHDHYIFQLQVHPNNGLIFSGTQNGSVKIWSLNNGHLNLKDSIRLISFRSSFSDYGSPDLPVSSIGISSGDYLSSNHADTLKISNFMTKESRFIHDIYKDTSNFIDGVTFSLNGKYFASSYKRNNINIWSSDSFVLLQRLQGEHYKIKAFSDDVGYISTEPVFSPSSKYLALMNDGGNIYLYKLKN